MSEPRPHFERPPLPMRRVLGKLGSGLTIEAIMGYDYSDLREYGEACVRAALERPLPKDWGAEYAAFKDGPAFPPDVSALKVAFGAGMHYGRRAALEAATKECERVCESERHDDAFVAGAASCAKAIRALDGAKE
jgi:hypothetical protein